MAHMSSEKSNARQLHLNAFLMTVGHHESAWRFPESSLLGAWDVKHYAHLAREAERGTFDSIFFGDGPALQGDVRYRPAGRLVVTTAGSDAAHNFGLDEVPAHRERYERASELVDVCVQLWDSWEEDLPSGLSEFVDQLVPLLRRRGLFRSEYTGKTLRDHYGLPKPQNQFSAGQRRAALAGGS